MGRPRSARQSTAAAAATALIALLALSQATGASAATTTDATSNNWAGYVARPVTSGQRFTSVSGTWTTPAATCSAGHETFSAVWVGLGGYNRNARSLEQIGTDMDCTRAGKPRYSTWVELLPAAPTELRVKTRPGDEMIASVTVRGTHATLRLNNLTTGERFSTTRRLASVDVSSADWIVEAPSSCGSGGCQTLQLANFAKVSFSASTATAGGRTRTATGGGWPLTRLSLRQGRAAAGREAGGGRAAGGSGMVLATPSPLAVGGAFSVLFSERAGAAAGPEAPTVPGGLTGG